MQEDICHDLSVINGFNLCRNNKHNANNWSFPSPTGITLSKNELMPQLFSFKKKKKENKLTFQGQRDYPAHGRKLAIHFLNIPLESTDGEIRLAPLPCLTPTCKTVE